MKPHRILLFALVACLLAVAHGCGALRGGAVGAATAAVVAPTPQAVGIGALAGFVAGGFEEIVSTVSGWWHSLFGQHIPDNPPAGTGSWLGVLWSLLALVVLAFALYTARRQLGRLLVKALEWALKHHPHERKPQPSPQEPHAAVLPQVPRV